MKKKIMGAAGVLAFAALLFIVGAIEHGAAAGLILLTIPALVVMGMSAKIFSYGGSKN